MHAVLFNLYHSTTQRSQYLAMTVIPAFCVQTSRLPFGTTLRRGYLNKCRFTASAVETTNPASTASNTPSAPARLPRVLSGVQPTGNLHLGNYLGAVRSWVEAQHNTESYFAIVDLHAITVGPSKSLRQNTLNATAMYLASGIDAEKSAIFSQNQIGAHAELMWLLSCVTPHAWLNRMIQFKEKAKKHGESASMGLFAYPILQAADVLLYRPDYVPVGEDQRQHIELARDIAKRWNDIYCAGKETSTFTEPELRMTKESARVMALDDGSVKMSKSAENDNSRINMTDTADVIARKIKRCKTDSFVGLEFDNDDRPECHNLLSIYQVVSGKNRDQVLDECAGLNWGKFKPLLTEALVHHVDPIRSRYEELLKDKAYLVDVLSDGYERANLQAIRTLERVKKDVGFLTLGDMRKIQKKRKA